MKENFELPYSVNDTTLADEFGESYCYGVGNKDWQPEISDNTECNDTEISVNDDNVQNRSHFVWYGSNLATSKDDSLGNGSSDAFCSRKIILLLSLTSLTLVSLTIGLVIYYLT